MSLGLGIQGHWYSFLGVVIIVVPQKPGEVGGTKAVETGVATGIPAALTQGRIVQCFKSEDREH